MWERIYCPRCDILMDHLRIDPPGRDPVVLDACFTCGGIWFDRGELARASKLRPAQTASSTKSSMMCPRCKVKMFDEWLGAEDSPAQSCFRCKGVWASGEAVDDALKLHPTGAVGKAASPRPPKHAGETVCARCNALTLNGEYMIGLGWLCCDCEPIEGEIRRRAKNWLFGWFDG